MIVYWELSSLERDLGFPAGTLYAVSNRLGKHYRQVEIPKSDGSLRTLSVPDGLLKAIQRRIAQVLLSSLPVSPWAMAYRPGGSVRRNAALHVGKPLVLKLDIYRFFDSISYSMVKRLIFPEAVYSEPNRILLSMLCCYRDALPQGAPTSPAISNRILLDFDWAVGLWCREQGITYTRYCDDLTFSGDFDPQTVIAFVGQQLRNAGFLLNRNKIRLLPQSRCQNVTGVVVNRFPQASASYRRKVRQEVYYCRKFGIAGHLGRISPQEEPQTYLRRLLGRLHYILQINPEDPEFREAQDWAAAELRRLTQP